MVAVVEGGLIGIVAGLQDAAGDLSAVYDDKIRAVGVFPPGDYIQQTGDAHLQTGLFKAFADGGFGGVFMRINEPGR